VVRGGASLGSREMEQQQGAPSQSSGKVMSKLNDGLSLASNALSQRFTKAARLFSAEAMAKPGNAWAQDEVYDVKLDGLACPPDTVEATFYAYRTLTDESPEGFGMEHFVNLVPQLDSALLERIYALVFRKVRLSFPEFLRSLHVLRERPLRARLGLIFLVLVGDRTGELTKELSLDVVATHLQGSLRFMGYGEREDARWLINAWEKALWPDAKRTGVHAPISYGEFVMRRFDKEPFVLECFGLFELLNDLALGRSEGRPPQKEGFLRKSFTSVAVKERWKTHWCVCRDGFFWYYNSDDSTFATPGRVLTLQKDARVELVMEGELHGFCLSQGPYTRKFLCPSKESARRWSEVLRANSGCAFGMRSGCTCRWMVDGKDTFEEMRTAIRWAKREIYITSWFFSAHVYLGAGERLDTLLQEKANEGVHVFCLIWNETKLTLDLNSHFSETYLESLHPNIRVLRHPTITPMKWSHHQKSVVVDQRVAFVGGLDLGLGRLDDQRHMCVDEGKLKQQWIGKDYYNPAFVPITRVELPFEDSLDRSLHPRMPWHDVHSVTDGAAAQDVARAFIERWNHHKDDLAKDASYPYLVPTDASCARRGHMRVKVLRSVSKWSCGVSEKEASIYAAYLDVIRSAEHFVYIENQFFISSLAGGADVQNTIVHTLMERILAAMVQKATFRAVIVLPVTPEGDWETDEALRNIMHWQQRTIRNFLAQLESQSRETADIVAQYVSFHSLRTVGQMSSGRKVSEQIYVHSKLIIVDDRVVIVGSANINDRSMLGDRDSEMCLFIQDSVLEPCVFNGNHYQVSRFAHSLRVALWLEHLGLPAKDASVEDPVCSDTYDLWRVRSGMNTAWYEVNFPAIPSDRLPTIASFQSVRSQLNPGASMMAAQGVLQGFLVDHPIKFLVTEKDMFVKGAAAAAIGSDVFV
jgi:phospholipase D1/2